MDDRYRFRVHEIPPALRPREKLVAGVAQAGLWLSFLSVMSGLLARLLNRGEQVDLRLGHWYKAGEYGFELVFLLDPGWLVSSSDFSTPAWRPAGMHGYHPDDPSSDAIFLSNQAPPVSMRTIADTYACMAHAAGLHETNAEVSR